MYDEKESKLNRINFYQSDEMIEMIFKYICSGSIQFLILLSSFSLQAQVITTVQDGFIIVNEFVEPTGKTRALGDMLFSADGDTVYVLSDSESSSSYVSTASLTRNSDGDVVGFGTFSQLFAAEYMDTGLTFAPGSNTLFYRRSVSPSENYISHRLEQDFIEETLISGYDTHFGGLAFIPDQYIFANNLIAVSFNDQTLNMHLVTDDMDGTFTVSPSATQVAALSSTIGDVEYITTGALKHTMIIATYADAEASLVMIPVNSVNGLPNPNPATTVIAAGSDGAWGVAIDPITDNIWSIDYSNNSLTQIKIDVVFKNGFE